MRLAKTGEKSKKKDQKSEKGSTYCSQCIVNLLQSREMALVDRLTLVDLITGMYPS